jgi:outer membrane protein assembly factor BamE
MELTRLTLFFEENNEQEYVLTQVVGDLRPDPQRAATRDPGEMLVSVPDWEDDRGFLSRAAAKVGLEPAE